MSQQAKSAMRGQRFNTVATAAAMPAQPNAVIIPALALIHSKLGARKKAAVAEGNTSSRCFNKDGTGMIPSGPIKACASRMMPQKTNI